MESQLNLACVISCCRCDDTRSTRRPSHDDPRLHRFQVDKFPDRIGFRCHERIPQLRYADSYEVNYLNNRVYPEDVYPHRRRTERRDYGPHGRRATGTFRDRSGYHWEARDPDYVEARRRQPISMVQRHDVTYSSDEHYCREGWKGLATTKMRQVNFINNVARLYLTGFTSTWFLTVIIVASCQIGLHETFKKAY